MDDDLLDDLDPTTDVSLPDDVPASLGDTTAMIAALESSQARLEADETSPLRIAGQGAHWAKTPSNDEVATDVDTNAAEVQDAAEDNVVDDFFVAREPQYYDLVGNVVDVSSFETVSAPATPYQHVQPGRHHALADESGKEPAGKRSAVIAAALVAAVVLIGCAVAWGALLRGGFGNGSSDDDGMRRASYGEIDKSRDVLLPKEIKALVTSSFVYNGKDISLPASGVGVEVRNGHVVVTHRLSPETTPNPKRIVRLAGQRAALLAEELTGQTVVHDESDLGAEFADLTWVVRAANGNVFLAVFELPGEMKTGAGYYGAITVSDGYVIAETLLKALGSSSGLVDQAGQAPVDVKGKIIVANATYEKPKKNTATDQKVKFDQQGDKTEEEKKDEDKKEDGKKKDKKTSTPSKPKPQIEEPSKPQIEPDPQPQPQPQPEPQPQPQPEPEPQPQPEPEPQPQPEPEPEPDPQPEPEPEPDPNPQPDQGE